MMDKIKDELNCEGKPYKCNMVLNSTDQLNFFPVKGGVSDFYSSRMIMKQENLNYNKHCLIPFSSFVQAEYDIKHTNTMHSRHKDAIFTQPVNSDQVAMSAWTSILVDTFTPGLSRCYQ
jgi:hypothetical protein